MQVMQFNSAAVGTGESILAAARFASQGAAACSIVVTSSLAGMTELMAGTHARASRGDHTYRADYFAVVELHRAAAWAIAPKANWSTLENRFEALALDLTIAYSERDDSQRMRDRITTWGERLAVTLFAGAIAVLGGRCHASDAASVVTDECFGAATPLAGPTYTLAQAAHAQAQARDAILIVPNGIGQTRRSTSCHKVYTMLDRCHPNQVATLIAAALNVAPRDIIVDGHLPIAHDRFPLHVMAHAEDEKQRDGESIRSIRRATVASSR